MYTAAINYATYTWPSEVNLARGYAPFLGDCFLETATGSSRGGIESRPPRISSSFYGCTRASNGRHCQPGGPCLVSNTRSDILESRRGFEKRLFEQYVCII